MMVGPSALPSRLAPSAGTAHGTALPRLVHPKDRVEHSNPRAGSVARVPLYHRSGTVALLDDDPDFVAMLGDTLPRGWRIRTFLSPNSCLNHLQQQPPKWEADFWAQQELVAQWRGGMRLIPLILRYWANHPRRADLTKVLVLDYLMPGRDGLDTLRDLSDWPGHRVLMTGAFDETLAVDAFNAGLIDQFIVKQHPDLRVALVDIVEGLLARPNPRHQQIWSATLQPPQLLLLQRRDIADELCAYLRGAFVEWVVLGEPFGILGIDADGVVHWVQLEPGRSLKDLAGLVQVGDEPGVLYAAVTRVNWKNAVQPANLERLHGAFSGNETSF